MNFCLLKGCTSNQFTCANGQCVPSASRCNNVRECSDGSDELNCGMACYFSISVFQPNLCFSYNMLLNGMIESWVNNTMIYFIYSQAREFCTNH